MKHFFKKNLKFACFPIFLYSKNKTEPEGCLDYKKVLAWRETYKIY